MLHGVEVTRLDAMDHDVELPGRAQHGVRRGREVDAVDHNVEPSTINQQAPRGVVIDDEHLAVVRAPPAQPFHLAAQRGIHHPERLRLLLRRALAQLQARQRAPGHQLQQQHAERVHVPLAAHLVGASHGLRRPVQLVEPPNARAVAVASDPAHRQRRAVGQNGLVHDAAAGCAKDVRRSLQQRLQLQIHAAVRCHQHRAVAALLLIARRRFNSSLAVRVCDTLLGGEGGRRVRDFLGFVAVVTGLLAQAAGKAPADGVRRLLG